MPDARSRAPASAERCSALARDTTPAAACGDEPESSTSCFRGAGCLRRAAATRLHRPETTREAHGAIQDPLARRRARRGTEPQVSGHTQGPTAGQSVAASGDDRDCRAIRRTTADRLCRRADAGKPDVRSPVRQVAGSRRHRIGLVLQPPEAIAACRARQPRHQRRTAGTVHRCAGPGSRPFAL